MTIPIGSIDVATQCAMEELGVMCHDPSECTECFAKLRRALVAALNSLGFAVEQEAR